MADQRDTFIRDRLVPAVAGEFLAAAADIADLNIDELNANISEALHRALRDDELTELRHFLDDLTITTRVIDMDNADSPFLLESGYHMPASETTATTSPTNISPSSQATISAANGGIRAAGPATAPLLPQATMLAFKIDSIAFGSDAADQELVRWAGPSRYVALRVDADGDLVLTDGANSVYPEGIRTLRVPVQTDDEIVLGMFPDTTNGTKLDIAYAVNGQSENIVETTFDVAGLTESWSVEFGRGSNVTLSSLRAIAHAPADAFYPSHGFLAGLAGDFDANYVLGLVSENQTTRHRIQIANLDASDESALPTALRQFLAALTIDATSETTMKPDDAVTPFDVATGVHLDESLANISPSSSVTIDTTTDIRRVGLNVSGGANLNGAVFGMRVAGLAERPSSISDPILMEANFSSGGVFNVGPLIRFRVDSEGGGATDALRVLFRSVAGAETEFTVPGATVVEGDVLIASFYRDGTDTRLRYSVNGTNNGDVVVASGGEDRGIDISTATATNIYLWSSQSSSAGFIATDKVRYIQPLAGASAADFPDEDDLAGYADHIDTFYTLGLVNEGATETTYAINSVSIDGLTAEASIADGSVGLPQLSPEVKAQIAAAANSQFSQAQVDEVKRFLADLDITSTSSNDDSATSPFTLAQGYHMPSDETSDTTAPTNDSPSSTRVPESRTLGGGRYLRVAGDYNPRNTVLAFRVDAITYGEGAAHQVLAAFRLGDSDTVVECRVDANGDLLFTDGVNDAYATGFTTTRVRVSAGDEIALTFRSDDGSHLTAIYSINGLNENDVQTQIDNPTATAFNIDFGVDEDATLSKCRAISAPSALSPTHSFLTGLAQHIDADYTLGLVSRTTTTTESVAIANLELAADSVAETMLASAVRTKLNATGGGTARAWVSGKFSVALGVATIEVPDDMTIGDFTRCAIIYAPTSATNDTTGNTSTTNNKLIFEEVPTPILTGSGIIYTQGLGRGADNISLAVSRQTDANAATSFSCGVVNLNTAAGSGLFTTGHIGGVWWY